MSKKDYELIARALKEQKPNTKELDRTINNWNNGTWDEWSTICLGMAMHLQIDNPRFNRAKFLQACGYND